LFIPLIKFVRIRSYVKGNDVCPWANSHPCMYQVNKK
jgi:hypothetical protein